MKPISRRGYRENKPEKNKHRGTNHNYQNSRQYKNIKGKDVAIGVEEILMKTSKIVNL